MAFNPYSAKNRLVAAKLTVGTHNILYAYRTNISDATMTELGLVIGTTTATNKILIAGAVIGANAPKPHRATKYLPSGETESSFVSDDKLETLTGWVIESPRFKSPPLSDSSTLVYVLTKVGATDVPYGWAMPNYQIEAITEGKLGDLGITVIADSEVPTTKALFGLNAPKPGRVKQDYSKLPGKEPDETSSSICSTFYGDAARATAITGGWRPSNKKSLLKGYTIP